MVTQNDSAILAALQSGNVLTPAIAADRWGCLALHSAVSRLRKLGHNIPCRMVTHGDRRHGEYRYVAPQENCAMTDPGAKNMADTYREPASAAPDDVMVTRYYVKDGKQREYSYMVSGYGNGRPVR